jgi:superfamily II DNA or RNA helicase
MPEVRGPKVIPLKEFQDRAQAALLAVIADTSAKIEADLPRRRQIALAQGVILLRAPTGSGKTLTVGRTLEAAKGRLRRKTCWFWFTPYTGLVSQTREALASQCSGLRLRDVKADRVVRGTRDGDTFVMTWASVASARKDARLARVDGEEAPGIDLMIAALRAEGFHIGAVIDEAHVNFGTSANQAAAFYLNVLRPDFTLLLTATPKDEELDRFRQAARIGEVNRIEVGREEVVKACLNKVGIKAVHFRADSKDERLLDMEEVAIFAGLERHRRVKSALAEAEVQLTPLLLIQVDNVGKGKADPVHRVKDILTAYGVDPQNVAVHTSGEPDPFFHTLAYDETKEILIFKVSAATGFDAPRAWTLVSLRQTTGTEFGLQILGRIMRVHQRVQHLHPYATKPARALPSILDYGYVFLANPAQQVGMALAADEIKTIQDGIETVTSNAVIIDFGTRTAVLLDPAGGFGELLDPLEPEREEFTSDRGMAGPLEGAAPGAQEPSRAAALRVQPLLELTEPPSMRLGPVHGSRPPQGEERPQPKPPSVASYLLREDISFPRKLAREVMPRSMDGLVACIAQRIEVDSSTLNLIRRTRGRVVVTEQDVFGTDRTTTTETVPLSPLRISQQAQLAFRFNESIDERDLKPALAERLKNEVENAGMDPLDGRELRRAVDLIAMAKPHLLHEACRACLAQVVEIRQDEEIPSAYEGPVGLERAGKSLYGVFPSDLNNEELAFARLLDDDQTGTVLWWLRNVSRARWAVSIVLPNGERHYPDFVIGVDARRRSKDSIALAEVKDDGRDGRLFATKNTDKVRTEHSEYRSALMVFRDGSGEWFNVAYRPDLRGHAPGARFSVRDLLWTQ